MPITQGRGLPDWTVGTATVANGSANVSFAGASLVSTDPATNAQVYVVGRGDIFVVQGVGARVISSVTDANNIVLVEPWTYASQAGVAYAIIRMSFPATGSVAKAVQDLLNIGTDTAPDLSRTIDDGAARLKARVHAGVPSLSVGPAGTADASLLDGIQFDPAAGYAKFPNGLLLPTRGYDNRIINGDFDFWQRGVSLTVANNVSAYTADRWVVNNYLGVSSTVSQAAALSGMRGRNAINIAATGAAVGGAVQLRQRMVANALADLDGKALTLSFDVNATTSAGTLTGSIYLLANSAADNGSWSNTLINGALFTIPVGSGKIVIPISAAQSVGIKNGAAIYIAFTQNGAVGNININVGAVQLEQGTVANDFAFRHRAIEAALCLRNYQKVSSILYRANSAAAYGGGLCCMRLFSMRVTPTIVAANSGGGTYSGAIASAAITGGDVQFWFGATGAAGDYAPFTATLDAEL